MVSVGRWVLYRCVTMGMAVFHALCRVLPRLRGEDLFLLIWSKIFFFKVNCSIMWLVESMKKV